MLATNFQFPVSNFLHASSPLANKKSPWKGSFEWAAGVSRPLILRACGIREFSRRGNGLGEPDSITVFTSDQKIPIRLEEVNGSESAGKQNRFISVWSLNWFLLR